MRYLTGALGALTLLLMISTSSRAGEEPTWGELKNLWDRTGQSGLTPLAKPGPARAFAAHLSGADAGVETEAAGLTVFNLSEGGTELRYRLIVDHLENALMAHIHLAPAGQNGPVVVWLYPDAPPPQLIEGRFDGVLGKGVITADDLVGPLAGMTLDDLLEALRQGNAYVNVHTPQYPTGEIRGQIAPLNPR